MKKSFDALWRFINARGSLVTVQEYKELNHIFDLMQDCESYLEVGTAEGNSLYVLAHALKGNSRIVSVDLEENHTRDSRHEILYLLKDQKIIEGYLGIRGNSHAHQNINLARKNGSYDAVLIDAGHTYADVIADAIAYGGLAKKYIFFHDIMLPEVRAAFEWYYKQRSDCQVFEFINSETFGYGILKII